MPEAYKGVIFGQTTDSSSLHPFSANRSTKFIALCILTLQNAKKTWYVEDDIARMILVLFKNIASWQFIM